MSGIGDQGDGVRQKAKCAFDDHENDIECHGKGHAGVDPLRRYSVSMPMRTVSMVMIVVMVMVMVMVMIVVMA